MKDASAIGLPVIVALIAGLAGYGIAASTIEPEVKTVTETVTVAEVPKACEDALRHADDGFVLAEDAMSRLAQAGMAQSRGDYDGAEFQLNQAQHIIARYGSTYKSFDRAAEKCGEEMDKV